MTTLVLDGDSLQCDCAWYWFVRATRERPQHARAALRGARCGGLAPDQALAPDQPDPRALTCALPPAAGCPAGCECRVTGEHSELSCARAGLARVPRAPPGLPARSLLLPHNNISVLTLDDITSDLEVLDLSDNLIEGVDAATMAALLDSRRIVCLAGNPLRCDAMPLLRTLLAHVVPRVGGAVGVQYTCPGAVDALATARELARHCAPGVWPYVLAGLALAAVSAVVAGCLVRPAARQHIKMFLFERGLCLSWLLRPWRAEDDAELPYDAFVSFSHHDSAFATELTRRLERGAALRLCLHSRDWRPGEWIPEQIARSVRESRRTLVLLSENFLSSTWARAELREAHALALRERRPRLLLVLLPGMSAERAAAADPELRAYIASVTYLRWDEPRFWDKLQLAMPKPRAPPAPVPPAPPAGPPGPPRAPRALRRARGATLRLRRL
ncbi:unnamed protein product [Euphydryas editha]|uniref:TIR domain-containing protein n=1 Tax=Euphydryas editha TaxID=104508 RepID=A0AAU9TEH5_EUPED|nr:unnamed protein product [Euphydryas editha]